jgi:transposase
MGGTDALSAQAASIRRKSLHSEVSYKRLEQGRFRWPPMTEGTVRLSAAQMAALLEGLEWSKLQPHAVAHPQVAC